MKTRHHDAFLGLDVGTQGARAVVCTPLLLRSKGERASARQTAPPPAIIASASLPFPAGTVVSDLPPRYVEQCPAGWWQAAAGSLRQVTSRVAPESIRALSVTSTSGTLLLLDDAGEPLIPALMYNDARADSEAVEVQAAGATLAERLGYRFNASYALAKLLWLARHLPEVLARARYVSHACDFIAGRLCGTYNITDYSNALKTGCDLDPPDGRPVGSWPDFIPGVLGLPVQKLPRVVPPGEVIGFITAEAAGETGLCAGTPVVAGMTDGCAAQIASGAVAPGDWNSSLGTTLVVKGVTARLIRDPEGRIYSHRHPDGFWLPGGASNVGGEILEARYGGADLASLDRAVVSLSPTNLVAYPLARRGERFPFVRPDAEAFLVPFSTMAEAVPRPPASLDPLQPQVSHWHGTWGVPDVAMARDLGGNPECKAGSRHLTLEAAAQTALPDSEALYAACLEGVAYVERLAYETLESLGASVGGVIRAAGGGSRSNVWLQIRADVLNREIWRPSETGAAMGAAILAASRIMFDGLIEAAQAMVHIEQRTAPRVDFLAQYEARYQAFRAACAERGYI